jgi:hypothetical protein
MRNLLSLVTAMLALPVLAVASPEPPPAPAVVPPPAGQESAAARPAGIAPGEEIEWRVDYLGVKTGRAKLSVGKPSGDIWPVIAQARTEGVAKVVEIKEHFVSYWHALHQTSNGNHLEAIEIGDRHVTRQRFDREAGKATVVKARKGKERHSVVDVPRNVHDMASALMWLRLQPLEPGARYEVPVFTGSDTFTLAATVRGRERVDTDVGPIAAVRVDVLLGFKDEFKTSRASQVWFSDDLRHVPVKMSADFAVGSVVATMTTYTPGAQVASR